MILHCKICHGGQGPRSTFAILQPVLARFLCIAFWHGPCIALPARQSRRDFGVKIMDGIQMWPIDVLDPGPAVMYYVGPLCAGVPNAGMAGFEDGQAALHCEYVNVESHRALDSKAADLVSALARALDFGAAR
jgi:hypothetical protein